MCLVIVLVFKLLSSPFHLFTCSTALLLCERSDFRQKISSLTGVGGAAGA